MVNPIDNFGDLSGASPSARINGLQTPSAMEGIGSQLGPILSILTQEFGGYSSPDQIAVLLASFRKVVGSGLPALDVVNAMYSNPLALDALRGGNLDAARQAIVLQVENALTELRAFCVTDATLCKLSASGFAAGEIASALREDSTFRATVMQGEAVPLRQSLTLHETFRDNGRSTHTDPTILAPLGERLAVSLGGGQSSYLENYMGRIRAAPRGARLCEVRLDDHPERMLFLQRGAHTRRRELR